MEKPQRADLLVHECVDLPMHGPITSFDTRLGKKVPPGMVLDFSKRQYRVLCESAVSSIPDAAGYARINITPGRANGAYYHDSREIEVQFSGNVNTSNATLRSVTSHYLKNGAHRSLESKYYDWARRLRRVGFAALWASVPVTTIAVDVYAINVFDGKSPPVYLDECIKLTGMVGIGGVLMALPYWTHPSEVRARYTAFRYSYIKPLALRPKSDYE